jgi:hypothetical protein
MDLVRINMTYTLYPLRSYRFLLRPSWRLQKWISMMKWDYINYCLPLALGRLQIFLAPDEGSEVEVGTRATEGAGAGAGAK